MSQAIIFLPETLRAKRPIIKEEAWHRNARRLLPPSCSSPGAVRRRAAPQGRAASARPPLLHSAGWSDGRHSTTGSARSMSLTSCVRMFWLVCAALLGGGFTLQGLRQNRPAVAEPSGPQMVGTMVPTQGAEVEAQATNRSMQFWGACGKAFCTRHCHVGRRLRQERQHCQRFAGEAVPRTLLGRSGGGLFL